MRGSTKFMRALISALLFVIMLCGCTPSRADSVTEITPLPVHTVLFTKDPSRMPTPYVTPESTPYQASPSPVGGQPLAGLIIGVDPGHQLKANRGYEPVAPGSSTKKHKVSSGTCGVKSGIREQVVNLNVGLKLQALLESAGATVVMTRTTEDVDITNIERAQLFNANNVDLCIRLHCNGSTNQKKRGAFMLVPKKSDWYDENVRAAQLVLEYYGAATGIGIEKGLTYRGDQTGFNWCTRPAINIEMGHMTNPNEDLLLTDENFQTLMAQGIYNGIVAYFAQR